MRFSETLFYLFMTLEKATEIDVKDYINLENPKFIGQTNTDSNNQYWMMFESNGVMYKIHNTL